MKTNRAIISRFALSIAAAAALSAAGVHAAPVDPVSNPDKLKYSDVEMDTPDYDVPFKRDGAVFDPATLRKIQPGLPAAQVEQLLGQPLPETDNSKGAPWRYNIKMHMPASENYLVCQYKIVFDDQDRVKEGVWRRHQCQDIVNGIAPK